MNRANKTFRDKLLDMENPNTLYRKKYEKEVQVMLEKELNHFWRAGLAVLGVVGLLAALPFVEVASSRIGHNGLGLFVRAVTVSGAVLAFAWTILMGWIAARGKLDLRTQPARIAAIGVALGFFFVAYFMFVFVLPIALEYPTDYRSICGIHMALMGFFLVVTIGLCLTLRALYRTEFRTREKLLQIEYRLVELSERIENRPSE